jgi:AcrR family transcriptional regulator
MSILFRRCCVMGVRQRKEQEREIRRKDIVDAAERVFFSKGYATATMDEVAAEAEFSKRTVYVYFASKEQLYFEIMTRGYRLLLGILAEEAKTAEGLDAEETLRWLFFAFYRFNTEHYEYFNAIIEYETKDLGEGAGIPAESRAECYRLGEQVLEHIKAVLAKGVLEGAFRAGLDAGKATLALWACTVGVFATAKRKESYLMEYHGETPESFISAAFELMARSLKK